MILITDGEDNTSRYHPSAAIDAALKADATIYSIGIGDSYNYGVDHYELGTAFGHIAIEVADAAAACDDVRAKGGTVTREAGPVKGGTTVIAFVADPDGYKIELIEHKTAARA